MRTACLLVLLAACPPPPLGAPRSACGEPHDHLASDHFELCVGRDQSTLCCLDGLEECLDPGDPYGVHECAPDEPCLAAYGACESGVTEAPSGRRSTPRSR